MCICLNGSPSCTKQKLYKLRAKRRFISLGLLKIEYKEQWNSIFCDNGFSIEIRYIKDVERWSKIARFQLKIFFSSDASPHPSNQRSRSFFCTTSSNIKKNQFHRRTWKRVKDSFPRHRWWDMMSLKTLKGFQTDSDYLTYIHQNVIKSISFP